MKPEEDSKPEITEEAWSDDKEENNEDEKKKTFNSSYEIIQDYSEYSTIQGLIYIFFSYQTLFGKIFWIIVIILMTILGIYWCTLAYLDWVNSPVLTTVKTTAYGVKNIDFPAVTICSPGYNEELFIAGLMKQVFAYFAAHKKNMTVTPYKAANILVKEDVTDLADISIKESILGDPLLVSFLNDKLSGLTIEDDLTTIISLLTSRNPDSDVSSDIAFEGGYNPCPITNKPSGPPITCEPGFVFDPVNYICYQAGDTLMTSFSASSYCNDDLSISYIYLYDDVQVQGFISLLKSGSLKLPSAAKNYFSVILDGSIDLNYTTKTLIQQNDVLDFGCQKVRFDPKLSYLELHGAACEEQNGVICIGNYIGLPNCNSSTPYKTKDSLTYLLDPTNKGSRDSDLTQKRIFYKNIYSRLNKSSAFEAIFSSLWYATLPCFDTRGVSGMHEGEKSVIRYCEWKGVTIPCSSIFTLFPTDQGMCCSFNIMAADEILKGSTYPQLVKKLQASDKSLAIQGTALPKKYVDQGEPKTLPGKNKGLVLMLDAHSDLFYQGSVDSDYLGFTGLVSPKGSFPFMLQESFVIKPGHNNIIALSGINVNADDSLKSLSQTDRQCLYPDENTVMKIHNNYTYSNCMFECSILYAMNQTKLKYGLSKPCTPWFFPSAESDIVVCDPWQAVDFFNFTVNDIPDDQCSYCLPDCQITMYDADITSIPFRKCDSSNIGVSTLCQLDNAKLPKPTKFANEVLVQLDSANPYPSFLKSIKQSIRNRSKSFTKDVFTNLDPLYEAYTTDISMVQIYFKKSTIVQMETQPSQTWVTYFSNVGGLLGLVLGMGIVSFIELIWLCCRLSARKMNLTHLVT